MERDITMTDDAQWRTDFENVPDGDFLLWAYYGCCVVDGANFLDRPGGKREYFNGDVYVDGSHWMPVPPPPQEGEP